LETRSGSVHLSPSRFRRWPTGEVSSRLSRPPAQKRCRRPSRKVLSVALRGLVEDESCSAAHSRRTELAGVGSARSGPSFLEAGGSLRSCWSIQGRARKQLRLLHHVETSGWAVPGRSFRGGKTGPRFTSRQPRREGAGSSPLKPHTWAPYSFWGSPADAEFCDSKKLARMGSAGASFVVPRR